MAWLDQITDGWCADADGAGGFTNWRRANDPTSCTNATTGTGTWWFAPLPQAQALYAEVASAPKPTNFYQDSTELFYLGLVAIVAVWAWKTFVTKLFVAS